MRGTFSTAPRSPVFLHDKDTADSGNNLNHSQSTWIQTTVTASAGDKVSFYWKVSSEQTDDYLKFSIDSVEQDRISGEVDWEKKSYSLSAGSRTLKWEYIKNGSVNDGDDKAWVDGLLVGTGSLVIPTDENSEALDSNLKFTESGDTSGWFVASGANNEYYYDGDALCNAPTTSNGEKACLQTIVDSDSTETIKFHWKVSCQSNYDYLRFYIDNTLKDSITGEVDWHQKEYTVSSGIHTLKWVYDDGGGSSGDNCGWVDYVQWSGPSPQQDPNEWQKVEYKYDVAGRRIEKKVDGFSTRYVHSGGSVIAEYDGNNNLLRKYVAGPGGPVCMIEEAEGETYYYHYDGSGNVVALSDSSGDTVQTYEYSVFGQVAASNPNHPNPYMFAGMRFEAETGLYFTGGPFYNPYIGRYLQQNYGNHVEKYSWRLLSAPSPVEKYTGYAFLGLGDDGYVEDAVTWAYINNGEIGDKKTFSSLDEWYDYVQGPRSGVDLQWMKSQPGWEFCHGGTEEFDETIFWDVQALVCLGWEYNFGGIVTSIEDVYGVTIEINPGNYAIPEDNDSRFKVDDNVVSWNKGMDNWFSLFPNDDKATSEIRQSRMWYYFPSLAILGHEIVHAYDYHNKVTSWEDLPREEYAIQWENIFRYAFNTKVPGYKWVAPRPAYGKSDWPDSTIPALESGLHRDISWDEYWGWGEFSEKGPWVIQL